MTRVLATACGLVLFSSSCAQVLLKILVISTILASTACATISNSGGDQQITVTSQNPQTKFYHNGRFIGMGHSATTYASGHGTDVLSGVQKGCVISQQNVKKAPSGMFLAGNIMSALGLGLLLGNVTSGAIGVWVASAIAGSALNMNLIIDASSGSWRSVTFTRYDLTPHCG